jgi:hypothetical protein
LEPPTLGREFVLPAQDEDYLSTLGRPWETIKDRNTLWLLIHEWEVPLGYSSRSTTIALLIPPGYADTQLDMVYFQPALTRQDGKPIGAISTHRIRETEFQRWSRHRTGANPWRPGVDDIAAHLSLVDEWLRREVA